MKFLIVGLGVIGGGYAMALKEAGYKDVYGVDKNIETLKKAKKLGIIKEGYLNEEEIISNMDVVVLAIYPDCIKEFMQRNKNSFKENAIITDVVGIKQAFINDIVEILPDNIDFIFAHPMAGREKKGIEYATNEVFKGANLEFIEDLAHKMGFKNIKRICPKYHDEMIAFTSQLPHVLAVSLINSDIEGRDTGKFIGDSYKELTRIANMNESLWSQLFLGNKENLLNVIDNFENELKKVRKCIEEENKEELEKLFVKSTKRREKLL